MVTEKVSIIKCNNLKEVKSTLLYFDEIQISQDIDKFASKLFEKAYIYVAKSDKLLGYIAFYMNDYVNLTVFISLICVKRELQSLGIGSKLLDFAESIARTNGFKNIKLEVKKSNVNAINFYKNRGFVIYYETANNSYILIKDIN